METQELTKVSINAIQHGKQKDIETPLQALADGADVPEKHGLFRIINQKDGDRRLVWNSMSISEINDARDTFNQLVEEGFVPHRVDPQGNRTAEVMDEFDPSAEETIFAPIPMLVGG